MKDILDFLTALAQHNNREWFAENKASFRQAETQAKSIFTKLFELMKQHDALEKMHQFRIYKDVRFSKDKTPYKTHFSCAYHRQKPQLRGGYYIQISPKEAMIATGFWAPEKDDLFRIRKEIELDGSELRQIIEEPNFKKIWGTLQGDELKTAPRGFDKNHPDMDLIKKKQYIFRKSFKPEDLTSDQGIQQIDQWYRTIRPFFDYMSDVLTTNIDGESLV